MCVPKVKWEKPRRRKLEVVDDPHQENTPTVPLELQSNDVEFAIPVDVRRRDPLGLRTGRQRLRGSEPSVAQAEQDLNIFAGTVGGHHVRKFVAVEIAGGESRAKS